MPKEDHKQYCDTSRIEVHPIAKSIAKDMIVKYHYTHAWTACRFSLGVYYQTDEEDVFGNTQKLIGAIVYGFPVGARAPTSICEGMTKDNVLELTRLYIHDGYGSNIESYSLGQSFKWLRENAPQIKLLISYADVEQDHLGSIYQATNWYYQGTSGSIALMPNFTISLQKDPYKWIHSRTVYSRWGSNNLEHLKREIGKEGYSRFWRRKEPDKHRYVKLIAQNKREKKDLYRRLKHEIFPYPKDNEEYKSEIEEYETYAPDKVEGVYNFW